jgi:hypothetical protein
VSLADADCYGNCVIYAHSCAYCYTNGYVHGYSEHYAYGYGYIHAYAECYSNSYSYGHRKTNAYRKAQRNSEATSHTAAAPLREPAWRFWGAHTCRVMLLAWRRNELSHRLAAGLIEEVREVRAGEEAIANTRDACAPRNIGFETSG